MGVTSGARCCRLLLSEWRGSPLPVRFRVRVVAMVRDRGRVKGNGLRFTVRVRFRVRVIALKRCES